MRYLHHSLFSGDRGIPSGLFNHNKQPAGFSQRVGWWAFFVAKSTFHYLLTCSQLCVRQFVSGNSLLPLFSQTRHGCQLPVYISKNHKFYPITNFQYFWPPRLHLTSRSPKVMSLRQVRTHRSIRTSPRDGAPQTADANTVQGWNPGGFPDDGVDIWGFP